MKRIAASFCAGCLLLYPAMAAAQSEGRAAIDLTVGGGAATNPYLLADSDTSAFLRVALAPSISLEDEYGRSEIAGELSWSQYSRRYGDDVGARIAATIDRSLDERNRIRLTASAQSLRSGAQDSLFGGTGGPPLPLDPTGPIVPVIDTTVAGTRTRITSVEAGVSLGHSLDERSSLSAGVAVSGTYFGDRFGADYRTAALQAGYARRVSERASLTLSNELGFVDYLGTRTGDSRIVSPRAGIRYQLSNRLNAFADAGISHVRTDVGNASYRTTVNFAGNVGICSKSDTQNLCLSAGRAARPTARGGVSTVTSAALTYDAQLSADDSVTFGANYGRTNADDRGLAGPTELLSASATYRRAIGDRLAVTVTPSMAKIFDKAFPRETNFALMVGLTFKLGDHR